MAIFAHFDPLRAVHEHTIRYLVSLSEAGLYLVFVSSSGRLALRALASLRFLANDRVSGFLQPSRETLGRIRFTETLVCGLTDSWQKSYQLQSYCLAFGAPALRSEAWARFRRQLRQSPSRHWIIRHNEVRLSRVLMQAGRPCKVVWPNQKLLRNLRNLCDDPAGGGADTTPSAPIHVRQTHRIRACRARAPGQHLSATADLAPTSPGRSLFHQARNVMQQSDSPSPIRQNGQPSFGNRPARISVPCSGTFSVPAGRAATANIGHGGAAHPYEIRVTHLNIDPVIRLPSILAADLADPLFWRPLRVGPASAWYGHLPFAFWLTAEHRPTLLVELGTHTGISYSAFCAAVIMRRLQTRCFAVDSWEGDQHTGAYGDDIFAEFQQFHDQHFRAFSTLLRMSFDAARDVIPDGTVDLLHIDGEHTYESVRHDFESWAPKLSGRSIVLFHDTNVRERNFGVWRLWRELREQHPGFEFYHSSGLGVLVTGTDVAPGVAALLQADEESAARMRNRFAVLGDGWEAEAHARQRADRIADQATQASAERAEFHQQWALAARERADLESRLENLSDQLDRARAELDSAAWREKEQQAATAQVKSAYNAALRDLAQVRSTVTALQEERALVIGSTSWRLTAPLRWFGRGVPYPLRRVGRKLLGGAVESGRRVRHRGADTATRSAEPRSAAAAGARHVMVVSGEAHTPGHRYRVLRLVEALAAAGANAAWLRVEDLPASHRRGRRRGHHHHLARRAFAGDRAADGGRPGEWREDRVRHR